MLKDLGSMLNEAVAKSRLYVRGSDQLRSMSKSLIAIFYKEYNTLANGPGTAEHELADATLLILSRSPRGYGLERSLPSQSGRSMSGQENTVTVRNKNGAVRVRVVEK